jgi:uncharacterized membrane protein YeaQ/YmgE (transglycosylase-associated protein family)
MRLMPDPAVRTVADPQRKTDAVCTGSHVERVSLSENTMVFGIIGWVVVGLLVGFIASKIVDLHGDDPLMGLGAACAGALIGAVLYTLISGTAVAAWNPWSLLWAAIGAVTGVVGWHVVRSRSVSRAPYTRRRSY